MLQIWFGLAATDFGWRTIALRRRLGDFCRNVIYDGAGRQSQINSTNCDYGSCNTIITTATKRSYDVDNHTLDTTQAWSGGGPTGASNVSVYDWGPFDHPIRIGSADAFSATPTPDSAATYDTLHWDGDQLIFTTNSGGSVDDIKVGASGDITPLDTGYARLTFWDRGPGGAVLYCHNLQSSAGSGQVLQNPYQTTFSSTPCISNGQPAKGFPSSIMWFNGPSIITNQNGKPRVGGPGQGNLLGMYRPDGISDGVNTIQGVRTVDASSSSWTTPDAFAGVVADPKTQKSYMWNGNNTVNFVDPSGYYAMLFFNPEYSGSGDPHPIDDPGAAATNVTLNGSPADQQRVSCMLNQIINAIQSLADTASNSLLEALSSFPTSTASAGFTINIDDNAVDVTRSDTGAVQSARIADFDPFDPTSITLHLGSVDALPAANQSQALEQGLVNDIGTAATLAGLIGNQAQQCEARIARNDDLGTNGEDKYIDEFANHWLLVPLGLPSDI